MFEISEHLPYIPYTKSLPCRFVFLVSRACCVALPRGAMGLSAVCDCGIS